MTLRTGGEPDSHDGSLVWPEAASVFEVTGVGSWVWDLPTGRITMDAMTAAAMGHPVGGPPVTLQQFLGHVHPDHRAAATTAMTRAAGDGTRVLEEFRVVEPTGRLRWTRLRAGAEGHEGGAVRIVGLAADTTELRAERERAGRVLQAVSDGVLIVEADWSVSLVNATAGRLLGRNPRELTGRDLWQQFPEHVDSPVGVNYRWAMQHQQPVTFETYHPPAGWLEVRAVPARDSLTVYLRSVDAEHASERERGRLIERLERALAHGRDLLELTRALSTAMTVADVAAAVRQHARDSLDVREAGIALLEDSRAHLRFVEADPMLADDAGGWRRMPLEESGPVTDAARLRRSFFHESIPAAEADFPAIGLHLATAGVQALACLPLSGRGGSVLGTLVLTWTEPRTMSDEERDFLLTTALHCGQALERAKLFEQQQTVTDALQRAVLPDRLPDVPGWELAARYVPATSGLEVGGDWYDAFVLPDGRLGLAVGDASGHGLSAARLMSTLRNALRAYAVLGNGPGDVLARLGAMLEVLDPQAMATVVYLEMDTDTGEASWASAGHPPPLWCRGSEPELEADEDADPPLGCPATEAPRQHLVRLEPGDGVLLYTDGLVERRDESIDVGLARLVSAARRHQGRPGDASHALLDAVVGDVLGGHGSGDDMCAVILRRPLPVTLDPPPSPALPAASTARHVSRTLHPRPQAAGQARRLVRGWLEDWGLGDVQDAALLVISEMVTNAVTHAEGLITVEASADETTLRLAVTDASHALPRLERADPAAEHGRGVDLVDMLSRRWGTDRLPVGKRVWAELDAAPDA